MFKTNHSAGKVMSSVFDRKGFFLVDFMPKNAEAYCNTLKKTQKSHSEPQKGNADPGSHPPA
jgi:hypothetical protein